MRFFRDVALAVVAVLAVLLLLELGLRLAGVRYTASLYTREAERGYALRPNAEGWQVEENENYVRINRDGNRDLNRTLEPQPGTLRIAIVGSSETEAEEVSLEKTFEAVIERELSKAHSTRWKNVEVMNFGVAGYGMAQEYLTLRDRVWKYHPQIVVLATTSFVLLTNTRDLYPFPDRGAPFFDFQNGELVEDSQTRLAPPLDEARLRQKNLLSDWMNRSYILLMLNQARSNAPGLIKAAGERWLPERNHAQVEGSRPTDYPSTWPYLPNLPQLQKSWEIADGLLKAMKKDCEAHNAEFWLVVLDMEMETHPDPMVREAFRQRLGAPSLYESDRRFSELAATNSIHSLLLAPILADYTLSHRVAIHGFFNTKFNDGHWNELGHQIAGEAIARELMNSSQVLSRGEPVASSATSN